MRIVVAALAEPVSAHDVAELRRSPGPGGSVVWLAQMVAAMPSIFGGTTEIMKEIIGRGLGLGA
jgi:hypothetical protein